MPRLLESNGFAMVNASPLRTLTTTHSPYEYSSTSTNYVGLNVGRSNRPKINHRLPFQSRRVNVVKNKAMAQRNQVEGNFPNSTLQVADKLNNGRTKEEYLFTKKDWDSFTAGFTSQYKEHALFTEESAVTYGSIPPDLQGTLLRNGPGLFEIGGRKVPQPFDGDGMVLSICFPGQGRCPFIANRFVRTEAFVREQKQGKMLYRGAFSVGNPAGGWFYNPFDFSVKKVANTNVIAWANKILALYERDLPYELESPDLRTAGHTRLHGALDGKYFGAHYRILRDERNGSTTLIGFQSEEKGISTNAVTFWELNERGEQVHRTQYDVPNSFAFIHDILATERYYILLENPIRLDIMKMATKYMFGKACLAECLLFDKNLPTRVHLIPRPGAPGETIAKQVFTTPSSFFSFHHANAYETQDGRIIIDTVALNEGMDFSASLDSDHTYFHSDKGRGTLTRLEVTPRTGKIKQETMLSRACEFPSVAGNVQGRRHKYVYAGASRSPGPSTWGPLQVVMKATLCSETGKAEELVYEVGRDCWAGEPIFVPRPGQSAEDDGWVLVMVFDSSRMKSQLHILDARDLKCVTIISLPFFVPSGLHGSWSSEYLGPSVEEGYKSKEYDIRNLAYE